MSDKDKNLPVPSGDNVPAKKMGTAITKRGSSDPAVQGGRIGTAVEAFRSSGDEVGQHIPTKKQTKGVNSGQKEKQPSIISSKWGFKAAAAASTAAALTAAAMLLGGNDNDTSNIPDGVIRFEGPYTHCINATQLSLHSGPSTSFERLKTMDRGLMIAVGGGLSSGWNELILEDHFGQDRKVYMLGGDYVIDLQNIPATMCNRPRR